MKNINSKIICHLLLMICLWFSSVANAESQLKSLNVNPLAGDKVALLFEFNSDLDTYTDKLHYRPNKLIIDIENASSILKLNPVKIDKKGINNVETERTADGLRLIIHLDALMPYHIEKNGKQLLVRFGDMSDNQDTPSTTAETPLIKAVTQTQSFQSEPKQSTSQPVAVTNQIVDTVKKLKQPPNGYVNNVETIDFKRGAKGQGKLLVYLGNSSVAVDIRRRGQQLIVEFQSTYIPDELLYIMDVVDFATVVQKVETFNDDGKTKLVFDIKGDYNYRYDQLDKLFIIEVSEKPKDEKENVYQGKAISLNFQDIPVRTVLQLIADFNGFNLVITDSVSGNITLRLDDVPWEQALDIILKVKGLGKRMDGNILMIAPATELANSESQQLESAQKVEALAPLYTEYIQINYAKAEDIVKLLSGDKTSLLSSRGSVSMDERTNTLLLKDTTAVIDSVKEMLKVLDVPVRQVVIEARMVTVSESVGEDFGVSWSESDGDSYDGSIVDLGFNSDDNSIGFQLGSIDGDLLDLELSALESESKGEIIASPRITTADQQTAYIEQGTEIPYEESSSSGATTISFEKAVLSLEVTPQITPDNKIILDLTINQDSVGEIVTSSDGTESVAIDTQEITTQVLVDNGETLVLGGIYQQTTTTSETKVPILGDIPFLGALFRQSSDSTTKDELLIFVTPRIVMQSKY